MEDVPGSRAAQLRTLAERLELPIALLALLVVPALILEDRATAPDLQRLAVGINWVIWVAFCGEFAILYAADPCWDTVKKAWFDLLLIVLSPPFLAPLFLQATRSLRALRILRVVGLLRAGAVASLGLALSRRLMHRNFHLVALVGTTIVVLGALGIFTIEGSANPAVHTFGDALWWAVVTATTVGYGDVSPKTAEGRLIAVVLMLTGIGLIGIFTATVASFFFDQGKSMPADDLVQRLDTLDRKMENILVLLRERDGK